MHAFILCHHQLSIGHQKTYPKINYSLLATVQCPRFYCHLLNFLAAWSHFIWSSDIKVLEPPYFLSTERLSLFWNEAFKNRLTDNILQQILANFSESLKECRRNLLCYASLIITLSSNTKGLTLLHQVVEIYGKVHNWFFIGDGSLLGTKLYRFLSNFKSAFLSKHNRTWSDAALCGVWSSSTLFDGVP